jgi:hypothetical protein
MVAALGLRDPLGNVMHVVYYLNDLVVPHRWAAVGLLDE